MKACQRTIAGTTAIARTFVRVAMIALTASLMTLLHVSMANAASCGLTSWYGMESGPLTASGQRFNPNAMTAAHRTLPFGTRLQVEYQGRVVIVTINDRGPAKVIRGRGHHVMAQRDLDLSEGAARAIGLDVIGVARTCWTVFP